MYKDVYMCYTGYLDLLRTATYREFAIRNSKETAFSW